MFVINYFRKKLFPVQKCPHYQRNCDKKAPCCGLFYPCRLCHDEKYAGPDSNGCKQEIMNRYNVEQVRCRKCGVEQPVSNKCIGCQIEFAKYFCPICRLYDDDPKKEIYHCEKCNMCRRGKQESNFHCDACGICLPKANQATHKCLNGIADDGCPVCLSNLKISTKNIQQLPNCPHFIHTDCLQSLIKSNSRNCPICSSPIVKMSQIEIQIYDKLAQDCKSMIPQTHIDLKVQLNCMDCRKQSQDVLFNFYLKCNHCGSYNTKQ